MAADVRGVIESELLVRPVVVGMSLGGLTAMRLAAVMGAALSGLVIVDVSPELHVDAARRIVDFVRVDREVDSIDDFTARALSLNPSREPELLRRSLLHNVRRLPNGRWTWKSDPRRLNATDLDDMKVDHARLWTVVANIRCPTLVVRGERSRVLLAEDAARLASTIPHASMAVVPGAGHTVQGDNPGGLLDVLEPFLAICFGGGQS
jgi:esterase